MNDELWMMSYEWWVMNDELWMMSYEWWVMNDEWWVMNDAYSGTNSAKLSQGSASHQFQGR